ncbi:terminase family protein [Blautia faecis]|jgi:hypothetical protein|uniref:terminase large subunit domain-containing protein n=1 Tax=Blautia faecis TaxID=871665 RepID=UPI0028A4D974|nr:terminase family protein [Blautia faecis]MDT4368433.1 terminase family protein [Blautia faecis]
MAREKKKSLQDVYQEKSERVMEGVAYWGAYYRKNPQRMVKEYLNINLKLFQKILIYMMMVSTNFMYIASRGSGKTWLTALYCVIRCILFPGTKICVASGYKAQSLEVIQKINDDFMKNYGWGSSNLRAEIDDISTSINNAHVDFRNGSWIKIVSSNDSARHNRANTIVVDEFRMVDLNIINTVLRKFLTAPRSPGYLNNPKYAHLIERNTEMYMSSAWYKSHWSYSKLQAYYANMLDDTKRYFCVGLPYQCAIREGLLSREQVEDEMSEADFDPVSFKMEMGAEWFGDTDGAFFKFDDISPRRKIRNSFYPLEIYKNYNIKTPELITNEKRVLSVDVALLASKKHDNDAAALIINSAIPTEKNEYISNIVYIETHEGYTTDELGILVMRLFYQFHCTDLVLDTNGQGIGVYDFIIKPQYDSEYGVTYNAMTCVNDDNMAARCKIRNAEKVIWSIKATADFNNKAAILLRSAFQNGNINLLASEFEAEEFVKKIRGYSKMTSRDQLLLKLPYVQTSLMVNELINLEHEVKGTNIRVFERSGMRKDRFSSLEYNYYIVQQELALKLKPKNTNMKNLADILPIRTAKRHSYFD